MAASIWLVSALERASGEISNCFERASKALAVLRSAVFCERMVVMSVVKGFRRVFVHFGSASSCCSVCRMIAGRFSVFSPFPPVNWFIEVNRLGYKYHLGERQWMASLLLEGNRSLLSVKCF
jgi:hypothetical protein